MRVSNPWWMAIPGRRDLEPWAHSGLAPMMEKAKAWADDRDSRWNKAKKKHLAGGQVEGGRLIGVLGELTALAVTGYPESWKIQTGYGGADLPGRGDVKSTRKWEDPLMNVNVDSPGRFFMCVALNLDEPGNEVGAVVGWATADLVFREDRPRHPSHWKDGAPYVVVHWSELTPWPKLRRLASEDEILAGLGMTGSPDDRAEALRKMRGSLFPEPEKGTTWD